MHKMKPVLVLFVFAHCFVEHVIGMVHPKYNCYGRPNEKFTENYNSMCDSYCTNQTPCPLVMTHIEGCVCKSGYYRNSQGVCVERWQCDTSPQPEPQPTENNPCWQFSNFPNEIFTKHFRPDCEPSCDEPQKACTLELVYRDGCTCKGGFLRNKYRICVEPWQCPANPSPPIPDWNLPQPWQPWQHQPWLRSLPKPRVFARETIGKQLEETDAVGGAEKM